MSQKTRSSGIASIAQERDINYNNNSPILPIDDPTTWDFIIR